MRLSILAILLAWSPATVWADAGPGGLAESAASGELPGIVAGIALMFLLGYALWTYAAPLIRERDRAFGWVLLGLLGLWLVKTLALSIFSGYALDLGTYEAWALQDGIGGPGADV